MRRSAVDREIDLFRARVIRADANRFALGRSTAALEGVAGIVHDRCQRSDPWRLAEEFGGIVRRDRRRPCNRVTQPRWVLPHLEVVVTRQRPLPAWDEDVRQALVVQQDVANAESGERVGFDGQGQAVAERQLDGRIRLEPSERAWPTAR